MSIIALLMLLTTITLLNTNSSQEAFDISFSQDDLLTISNDSIVPGFYVDQNYSENNRTVRTPDFELSSPGFYTVTINYENNISPNAMMGCSTEVIVTHNEYNITTQQNTPLLTSNASPLNYMIFVPYSSSTAYISVKLEADDVLAYDEIDDTKYLLVREVSIHKDTSKTRIYYIKRIVSYILILFALIISAILTHSSIRSAKNKV